ncbi:Oidioi.mRNA.OKI2018_I69.chr1.g3564.t1.cds [Oikopleura dioica]|uniref:Oidioi.mRNA.OKI2018_I69.chr1.g3564.t1.cds n=1 Tax=Oikopleura dioica TaxID=34765 RepID=A0ABN7SZZ0_OIKDI|nr:Oidioi.mRNA.OKI2018_I69.chr1.g3564.t1.cds [Oikopleura dioica]
MSARDKIIKLAAERRKQREDGRSRNEAASSASSNVTADHVDTRSKSSTPIPLSLGSGVSNASLAPFARQFHESYRTEDSSIFRRHDHVSYAERLRDSTRFNDVLNKPSSLEKVLPEQQRHLNWLSHHGKVTETSGPKKIIRARRKAKNPMLGVDDSYFEKAGCETTANQILQNDKFYPSDDVPALQIKKVSQTKEVFHSPDGKAVSARINASGNDVAVSMRSSPKTSTSGVRPTSDLSVGTSAGSKPIHEGEGQSTAPSQAVFPPTRRPSGDSQSSRPIATVEPFSPRNDRDSQSTKTAASPSSRRDERPQMFSLFQESQSSSDNSGPLFSTDSGDERTPSQKKSDDRKELQYSMLVIGNQNGIVSDEQLKKAASQLTLHKKRKIKPKRNKKASNVSCPPSSDTPSNVDDSSGDSSFEELSSRHPILSDVTQSSNNAPTTNTHNTGSVSAADATKSPKEYDAKTARPSITQSQRRLEERMPMVSQFGINTSQRDDSGQRKKKEKNPRDVDENENIPPRKKNVRPKVVPKKKTFVDKNKPSRADGANKKSDKRINEPGRPVKTASKSVHFEDKRGQKAPFSDDPRLPPPPANGGTRSSASSAGPSFADIPSPLSDDENDNGGIERNTNLYDAEVGDDGHRVMNSFFIPVPIDVCPIGDPKQFDFCQFSAHYGLEYIVDRRTYFDIPGDCAVSVLLAYISTKKNPAALVRYDLHLLANAPITNHLGPVVVFPMRLLEIRKTVFGLFYAYYTCNRPYCSGKQRFFIHCEDILYEDKDGKYKIKKEYWKDFFCYARPEAPACYRNYAFCDSPTVSHCCTPFGYMDIAEKTFEEFIRGAAADGDNLVNSRCVEAYEKVVKERYGSWSPAHPRSHYARKLFARYYNERRPGKQLENRDPDHEMIPRALSNLSFHINGTEIKDRWVLYRDECCLIVGSISLLKRIPQKSLFRIMLDGTFTPGGGFAQLTTVQGYVSSLTKGEELEMLGAIYQISQHSDHYKQAFASFYRILATLHPGHIFQECIMQSDSETSLIKGWESAMSVYGIRSISVLCIVHIIRAIFRCLKSKFHLRQACTEIRFMVFFIASTTMIRPDIVVSMIVHLAAVLLPTPNYGNRIKLYLMSFVRKVLVTIWGTRFSSYPLLKYRLLGQFPVVLSTNPSEVLHSSLANEYRKSFYRSTASFDTDLKLLHSFMERKTREYLMAHNERTSLYDTTVHDAFIERNLLLCEQVPENGKVEPEIFHQFLLNCADEFLRTSKKTINKDLRHLFRRARVMNLLKKNLDIPLPPKFVGAASEHIQNEANRHDPSVQLPGPIEPDYDEKEEENEFQEEINDEVVIGSEFLRDGDGNVRMQINEPVLNFEIDQDPEMTVPNVTIPAQEEMARSIASNINDWNQMFSSQTDQDASRYNFRRRTKSQSRRAKNIADDRTEAPNTSGTSAIQKKDPKAMGTPAVNTTNRNTQPAKTSNSRVTTSSDGPSKFKTSKAPMPASTGPSEKSKDHQNVSSDSVDDPRVKTLQTPKSKTRENADSGRTGISHQIAKHAQISKKSKHHQNLSTGSVGDPCVVIESTKKSMTHPAPMEHLFTNDAPSTMQKDLESSEYLPGYEYLNQSQLRLEDTDLECFDAEEDNFSMGNAPPSPTLHDPAAGILPSKIPFLSSPASTDLRKPFDRQNPDNQGFNTALELVNKSDLASHEFNRRKRENASLRKTQYVPQKNVRLDDIVPGSYSLKMSEIDCIRQIRDIEKTLPTDSNQNETVKDVRAALKCLDKGRPEPTMEQCLERERLEREAAQTLRDDERDNKKKLAEHERLEKKRKAREEKAAKEEGEEKLDHYIKKKKAMEEYLREGRARLRGLTADDDGQRENKVANDFTAVSHDETEAPALQNQQEVVQSEEATKNGSGSGKTSDKYDPSPARTRSKTAHNQELRQLEGMKDDESPTDNAGANNACLVQAEEAAKNGSGGGKNQNSTPRSSLSSLPAYTSDKYDPSPARTRSKKAHYRDLRQMEVELATNALQPQQLGDISLGNTIRDESEWSNVFVERRNVPADSNLPESILQEGEAQANTSVVSTASPNATLVQGLMNSTQVGSDGPPLSPAEISSIGSDEISSVLNGQRSGLLASVLLGQSVNGHSAIHADESIGSRFTVDTLTVVGEVEPDTAQTSALSADGDVRPPPPGFLPRPVNYLGRSGVDSMELTPNDEPTAEFELTPERTPSPVINEVSNVSSAIGRSLQDEFDGSIATDEETSSGESTLVDPDVSRDPYEGEMTLDSSSSEDTMSTVNGSDISTLSASGLVFAEVEENPHEGEYTLNSSNDDQTDSTINDQADSAMDDQADSTFDAGVYNESGLGEPLTNSTIAGRPGQNNSTVSGISALFNGTGSTNSTVAGRPGQNNSTVSGISALFNGTGSTNSTVAGRPGQNNSTVSGISALFNGTGSTNSTVAGRPGQNNSTVSGISALFNGTGSTNSTVAGRPGQNNSTVSGISALFNGTGSTNSTVAGRPGQNNSTVSGISALFNGTGSANSTIAGRPGQNNRARMGSQRANSTVSGISGLFNESANATVAGTSNATATNGEDAGFVPISPDFGNYFAPAFASAIHHDHRPGAAVVFEDGVPRRFDDPSSIVISQRARPLVQVADGAPLVETAIAEFLNDSDQYVENIRQFLEEEQNENLAVLLVTKGHKAMNLGEMFVAYDDDMTEEMED